MAERGWITATWPREYGGLGWEPDRAGDFSGGDVPESGSPHPHHRRRVEQRWADESPSTGSSMAVADEVEGQCAISRVAGVEKASPDIVTWFTIGDRPAPADDSVEKGRSCEEAPLMPIRHYTR